MKEENKTSVNLPKQKKIQDGKDHEKIQDGKDQDFMWLPDYIHQVFNVLNEGGFSAYLVGGCTRDFLLDLPVNDYDFTSSATPEEVMELFKDYSQFYNGLKHGTVSIVIEGHVVEITTYRVDGAYKNFRHPEEVIFTKRLMDDISRRDFTINSIAYSPEEGFVDYFGGKNDLSKRLIRAIGEPSQRFQEDALRIMRALRFASSLGFDIEEATWQAMVKNRHLLSIISAERKAIELTKLLLGQNVKKILTDYYLVLDQIMPEITLMKGFNQNSIYHVYDILEHTALVVANSPKDLVLRLAAFFHDVGKVHTYTESDDGTGHFYGHNQVSADIAHRVLRALKFDNETTKKVVKLVKYHDRYIEENTKSVKRAMNKMGEELFFKLLDLKKADNLAQSPEFLYRLDDIENLRQIAFKIIAENQCFSLANLAVNGRDMLALGLKGREIGQALEDILQAVLDETISNDKEAILSYIKGKSI